MPTKNHKDLIGLDLHDTKDNSVNTPQLVNGAVTTDKILDGNVTTDKILDGNVTTDKILDGNVTLPKLDPAIIFGNKFYFITPSVLVLDLANQNSFNWTPLDLSAYIPADTIAIICEIGINSGPGLITPSGLFQLRRDNSQGLALNVVMLDTLIRGNYNSGIVPVITQSIEYKLTANSVNHDTMIFIRLIGYIQ